MNNDTEERTETHACDCIIRAAAIDSLDAEIEITGRTNAEVVKGYVRLVKDRLERLPSAQPTQNERVNSNNPLDCISRQAAITAIQKAYADTEGGTDKCAVWKNVGLTNALHIMQDLPPVQPEPEHTMEEFMYGQDLGSPEDGSL